MMRSRFYGAMVLAVALLAMPLAAASAHTTIIEPPGSHFPYQRWVEEAKEPTPDITLTIIETNGADGCPVRALDYAACTSPSEGIIWISPEDASRVFPRQLFYHEIGHNVDGDMLTPWMRERFMALFNLGGEWRVEGEPPPYSPNEQFADVWAQCAYKPRISTQPHWGVGPIWQAAPIGGAILHNRICRMFARF